MAESVGTGHLVESASSSTSTTADHSVGAGDFELVAVSVRCTVSYPVQAYVLFKKEMGDGSYENHDWASGYVKAGMPLSTHGIIFRGPGVIRSIVRQQESTTHTMTVSYRRIITREEEKALGGRLY